MFKTIYLRLEYKEDRVCVWNFCHLIFGFVSDFEIRISNLKYFSISWSNSLT